MTIHDIENIVCAEFSCEAWLLHEPSRLKEVVCPRQICIKLMREFITCVHPQTNFEQPLTLSKIGDYFDLHYSTILYTIRLIDGLHESDNQKLIYLKLKNDLL